jgi:hypothetical protein
MLPTDFEQRPSVEEPPLRSIVAAWAVAIILLSVGGLFISFHNRAEIAASQALIGRSQAHAGPAEDNPAW